MFANEEESIYGHSFFSQAPDRVVAVNTHFAYTAIGLDRPEAFEHLFLNLLSMVEQKSEFLI